MKIRTKISVTDFSRFSLAQSNRNFVENEFSDDGYFDIEWYLHFSWANETSHSTRLMRIFQDKESMKLEDND